MPQRERVIGETTAVTPVWLRLCRAVEQAVFAGQPSRPAAGACGADILVCGRHFLWSKPPGLPHRQSCRWMAFHCCFATGCSRGAGIPMRGSHSCLRPSFVEHAALVGQATVVGQAFQPAAGFRADLTTLYPPPLLNPIVASVGADRRVRPFSSDLRALPCSPKAAAPVEQAARLPTPAIHVEQAARLAMPAVTPAEPHNPDLYGSSNAIQPARLRAPPQPAAPCRGGPACPPPLFPSPCSPCPPWFVFSVPSVSCPMWGRPSSLRPAFQPALVPFTHHPPFHPIVSSVGADRCVRPTLLSVEHAATLATPAILVEQAARLAMPAVTPAEPHNPDLCGSSKRHPARTTARSTSTRRRPVGADQRVRPLFSYLRVLRGLLFSVFSVSSVVCFFRALRLRALPTPSHNLPQIFSPLLFNHLPTPPFSFSCSPLVC